MKSGNQLPVSLLNAKRNYHSAFFYAGFPSLVLLVLLNGCTETYYRSILRPQNENPAANSANEYQVGAGEVDITPPPGYPICGSGPEGE